MSKRNVLKNCCINENKIKKREKNKEERKKKNRMLMSAIKSIKIAKLVFTQKEFDKEKKVNFEEFDKQQVASPHL